MNEPSCIRIFNDRKAATNAVMVLKNAGFEAYYKEDRFGELTLKTLGIRPRFRLYVERQEINNIAKFLGEQLKW